MVVITGASSGIGLACARAFAKNKQSLYLLARREDRLTALAQELRKTYGVQVEIAALDVRDRVEIQNHFQLMNHIFERTEILINNAGLAKGVTSFQNGNLEDWDAMIDTNIKGLLNVTRLLLPTLIKNKGHIINIGSVAGRWVYPNGNVYCATKHAVRALNEGLRLDLHGTGVRVTSIDPGMVETEFSQVRLGDNEKAKAVYEGMTPLTAVDIADAVVWSTQRPHHVNIQEIVIFPTDQSSTTLVNRRPPKRQNTLEEKQ